MSPNKNSIGTIILISCAAILLIVGLPYSLMGGAKADVVTKEQAEADSLRTVLRETQQKLMEEQRQKEVVPQNANSNTCSNECHWLSFSCRV